MARKKLFLTLSILALAIAGLTSWQTAYASAYTAAFTTSITYQNVGTSAANIVFSFYNENSGTEITYSPAPLAQGAGGSVFVGNLNQISAGFSGSAVMSSDQPVVATLVQISSDTAVKNRPLSNGFSSGSSSVLLASVLKNRFNTTSRFSIQNAHSTPVDVTIEIFNADNPTAPPITVTHDDLPVGAAKYFDMGTLAQVTSSTFNGSAVVTGVEANTSTPANIVGTAMELSTTGSAVSAFEGIPAGANTVYMPSALCQAFGATSFYAIQNTSSSSTASVTVTYSDNKTETASIAPGAKASINTCSTQTPGYSGSATITSTGGPIIVIGKVSGSGISSAFLGATSGAERLSLPYVRFTSNASFNSGSRQRAFIAIQNVGAPLSAGDVVLSYVDRNGKLIATHTLGAMATGAKLNSNPSDPNLVLAAGATQAELDEFGYLGGFGAGTIIQGPSGSELVAVVRVVSKDGAATVGEDYNGIPSN